MSKLASVSEKLVLPESRVGQYQVKCPAHDDNVASLSVQITPNKVNIDCKAGCECSDVLSKAGLVYGDLYLDDCPSKQLATASASAGNTLDWSKPVATYDYRDESGNLLYQVLRLRHNDGKSDKHFRQRVPKQGGGWSYKLGSVSRVLYRLPALIDSTGLVLIAEGEKDVENLRNLGLVATCNSGGAGKWQASYSEFLKRRDVAILADNDISGEEHAEQVASSLDGIAASVKIVKFDEMEVKSDISDWLSIGNTKSDLLNLIDKAPEWTANHKNSYMRSPVAAPPLDNSIAVESGRTDAANATRFVDEFGHMIRFVVEWNKWLVWDGRRWKVDDQKTKLIDLARKHSDGLWNWLSDFSRAGASRDELGKVQSFIRASNNLKSITAYLKLARSDARVNISFDQLNRDPLLLNVKNGTINLETGEHRPHDPNDLVTHLANIAHDKSATCPSWKATLELIFNRDFSLIEFVQKLIGYSASGCTGEHIMPICVGPGENGKSTVWNPLIEILGDYATLAGESLLLGYRNEHPTEKALLYGKRFVALSEPDENARLKESRVKELTGDEWITARRMGEDYWTFRRTHTFWLATNHLPMIRGTDNGIWRRLKVIPFDVKISDHVKVDKNFVQKLISNESSGILNWIILGFKKYQHEGLIDPPAVVNATQEYRNSEDVVGKFLNEFCTMDDEFEASSNELFAAFEGWVGINSKWNMTNFGKSLSNRFEKKRSNFRGKKQTVYVGVKLRDG